VFDPEDVEDLNKRFEAVIREKANEERQRGHKWSGGGFQQWLDDLDNEEWDWPWGMGT
jgi:hypothetical protein